MDNYDIHDRHRLSFWVRLTLTAPLSHIKRVVGNASEFSTIDIMDLEGIRRPCPVYNANAWRGWVLRRIGNMGTLDHLKSNAWNGDLSSDAHHAVFSGGSLSKGSGTVNSMALYDYVARFYPPLRLLGTAKPGGLFGEKGGMIMDGLLDIGNLYLVCYEAIQAIDSFFLPPEVSDAVNDLRDRQRALDDMRGAPPNDVMKHGSPSQKEAFLQACQEFKDYRSIIIPIIRGKLSAAGNGLTEQQSTRRDSHHDVQLLPYLRQDKQFLLKQATDSGTIVKTDKEKSDQMITVDELACPGVQFVARWDTRSPGITDVEEGYLVFALEEWSRHNVLGGKASRGNGGYPNIEIWYAIDGVPKGRYLEFQNGAQQLSGRAEAARQRWQEYLTNYRDYLQANQDAIAGFIGG